LWVLRLIVDDLVNSRKQLNSVIAPITSIVRVDTGEVNTSAVAWTLKCFSPAEGPLGLTAVALVVGVAKRRNRRRKANTRKAIALNWAIEKIIYLLFLWHLKTTPLHQKILNFYS